MVDIVLVQCPNPVLETPTMYPNLGILYLVASLERANYKVHIADLRGEEANIDLIPDAPFIGFSATTGEIADAKKLARLAKQRNPSCKTIIGGAHASILYEDCSIRDFDCVVVGEGEYAILDILQGMQASQIVQSRITDLDDLPFPARHLVNSFSYTLMPGERYGEGVKATSVMFSRGCPQNCSFCANVHRAPVTYRSPENIRDEVKELISKHECRAFRVEDDNFTLNKKWMLSVCEVLAPLEVSFKCHSRGNLIDEESVVVLKEAGCVEVGIGLESADQAVLNKVDKGVRVHRCARTIQLLRKHGVGSKVYFVLHLPGESIESIGMNKDFMRATAPDKWTLSRLAPFPGSAIFGNPKAYGITWVDPDFSHYWNFWPHALIEYEDVSRTELDRRYHEFYAWLKEESWRQ